MTELCAAPKISVILTSYNHEKYLSTAIDSVLAQTFTDFELIIIDDCSSDSSWDIIQSYSDPRIAAVRHETNKRAGIIPGVFPLCKGKYIAIHHSDDAWLPEKLEKQAAYLDAHPETAACFTLVQLMNEEGQDFYPAGDGYAEVFNQPNRDRFQWLRTFYYEGNKVCHPSVLIRKEAYTDYGMFTSGLAQLPDFVQWIRLCRNAEIHIIQERLTRFRLRDAQQNTSGERYPVMIRDSLEWYFLLTEFLCIGERDFCKIFPESEEYRAPNGLMAEYAFARMCLDAPMRQKRLFGLETLYRLLNTPEKAALLEEWYGFTKRDFIELTEKFDVFGLIGEDRWQDYSLFADCGNGFSLVASKTEYIRYNRRFSLLFDLSEYQNIKAVRFCPQSRGFGKFRIDGAVFDGQNYEAVPIGFECQRDGFDVFLTLNPLYHISTDAKGPGKKLVISGELHPLACHDVFTLIEASRRWHTYSLFLYMGNGFSHGVRLEQTGPSGPKFSLEYDLSEYQNIKAIKFCPRESCLGKCRIDSAVIDGQNYNAVPIGFECQRDGFDFFLALNPQYCIEGSGKKLRVSGELQALARDELSGLHDDMQWQTYSFFLNLGRGFSRGVRLTKTVPYSPKFSFEIDLSEYQNIKHQSIKSIRFCPREGFLSRCRLERVLIDGQNHDAAPLELEWQKDGFDIFLTPAPMYHIKNIKGAGRKLLVSGECYPLSHQTIYETASGIRGGLRRVARGIYLRLYRIYRRFR